MSQRNAKRVRRDQRASAPVSRGSKDGPSRTVIAAVVVVVAAALVGGYFAARGMDPAAAKPCERQIEGCARARGDGSGHRKTC